MKEINAMSLFKDLRKAKVGDEFRLRDYEINGQEDEHESEQESQRPGKTDL